MGPSHACEYVDIFMSELDEKLVRECPVPLLSSTLPQQVRDKHSYLDWSRFRDDGFTVLLNENHADSFGQFLQLLHPPNIKWTIECGQSAHYLDVALQIKDGKIETDIFSKNNHSYLPPTSCHAPSTFKGLIQGMGIRLRMIINDDEILQKRIEEYAGHLSDSGWNYDEACTKLKEGASKNREEILKKPRKKKPKKLAWVSTYDPRVPSKHGIIKNNLHLLYADSENIEFFPSSMIISADRKRQNLGEIYKPTIPKRWPVHGPAHEPGFFVCGRKCDTCAHSESTKEFRSPWDGRRWHIKQHITCTTPNTIYIITCKIHSDFWYVGSTENIKKRWRGHKSDINLGYTHKCATASHFHSPAHPRETSLPFVHIFAVESTSKNKLGERELFWQCNVGSLFQGSNKRKDLPTQNRIQFSQ